MEKGKKTYFWGMFGFFPKMRTFMKNLASSVFDPWDPITSCEISEKSYKTVYLLRSKFNYHVLEASFPKKNFSNSACRQILCFPYIGSLFGSFRNDPSRFAVQWKRKCCWIDLTRFLFSFGAIRYDNKDCLHVIHINFSIKSIDSY